MNDLSKITGLCKRRAITFDAAFTLLRPSPSVGDVYARVAAEYGVRRDPNTLEQRFRSLYPANLAAARSRAGGDGVFTSEAGAREWWLSLCQDVLKLADSEVYGEDAPTLREAARAIYEEFSRGACWAVYDDVIPVLKALAQRGLRLAVVSNWDKRLLTTLSDLGLASHFEVVGVSTLLGYEKPDPRVFHEVARQLGVRTSEIFHVGDSLSEDVEGALSAGAGAAWLHRGVVTPGNDHIEAVPERVSVITSLAGLLEL